MKYTYNKLLISGNILEFDNTERPSFYGTSYRKPSPRLNPVTNLEENQVKSVYRAKKKVRHLVNANVFQWFKPNGKPYLPIFITFTFKQDIRDVEEANNLFTDAIARLNYYMTKRKKNELQYLAVIEFQDENRKGVIHYHVLFFNMRFVKQAYDEIKKIWKHGNVNVESVTNVKNLAYYMVKYMTKSMKDGRLAGKKKYFVSRKLLKPIQIFDESIVLSLIEQIPNNMIISSNNWQNKHCGKYTRITYDIANNPEIRELIELHRLMVD